VYFVFEIEFKNDKAYIATLLEAVAEKFDVEISLKQTKDKLIMSIAQDDPNLESYLLALEGSLPASIYLGESKHYFSEIKPAVTAIQQNHFPQDISLCPTCQKEMFDVSSRRYYYPFTSCNACGSQHAFVTHYPYSRQNSSMKFIVPCEACEKEMKENPLRRAYPLISCGECGISLKMVDKKSERYANDKGSYRTLFEVAARAITGGKTVLMKTTHGYRRFFNPAYHDTSSKDILLVTEAGTLNKEMMMITEEFNALLSVERPILRVATKSDEMKALFGSSTWIKYPDDGMSMLLAKELSLAGLGYVVYSECDENAAADFLVDFDVPVSPQKDFKLFISQDTTFLVSGRRAIFPSLVKDKKPARITVAGGLASVRVHEDKLIDEIERFADIRANEAYLLEEGKITLSLQEQHRYSGFKASMMSVLATHDKLQERAVGVHFDDALHFLYYNQKEVIDVVPPRAFETKDLFAHIAQLREGSDRLVDNYQKKFPALYERLNSLEKDRSLFEVTAIMLGLEEESFDGISSEALQFLGKGGLQIDTKIADNRFNDYAFLASIMSYQLSGTEANFLCYSIYESFGDYIAEVVNQIMEKTKSTTLTLSGESFANQALWGRIQRNLGLKKPLLNSVYPIGKESVTHGANYL